MCIIVLIILTSAMLSEVFKWTVQTLWGKKVACFVTKQFVLLCEYSREQVSTTPPLLHLALTVLCKAYSQSHSVQSWYWEMSTHSNSYLWLAKSVKPNTQAWDHGFLDNRTTLPKRVCDKLKAMILNDLVSPVATNILSSEVYPLVWSANVLYYRDSIDTGGKSIL